jgi:hemolysin III
LNFPKMKEPVNTWTHLLTLVGACIALPVLIALTRKDLTEITVVTIYGVSMVVLYCCSTLYHWIKTTPQKEMLLRRLDHGAINFLIAGSCTPIFYFGLSQPWQTAMIALVWFLAIVIGIFQVIFIKAPRWLQTSLYILLGWTAVIPFPHLIKNLPASSLILVGIAGLSYMIGAIVYATKKLNFIPGKFGFHEVFHLFVSAGTIAHFIAVLLLILPHGAK